MQGGVAVDRVHSFQLPSIRGAAPVSAPTGQPILKSASSLKLRWPGLSIRDSVAAAVSGIPSLKKKKKGKNASVTLAVCRDWKSGNVAFIIIILC